MAVVPEGAAAFSFFAGPYGGQRSAQRDTPAASW